MIRVFVGLFFLASSLGAQSVRMSLPRSYASIGFVDSVIDELVQIADTSQLETVRCLLGRIQDGNPLIHLAVTPRMGRRDWRSVEYSPCPVETVGLWHNHTPQGDIPNATRCFLSRADIDAAVHRLAPILQVVGVRGGILCWWSKGQVYQANQEMTLQPMGTQVFKRNR